MDRASPPGPAAADPEGASLARRLLGHLRGRGLGPGSALPPQAALAEGLAVAPGALRAGLRSLAILGAVDLEAGRAGPGLLEPALLDPFAPLPPGGLGAVAEARRAVEPMLAARAATRLDEAGLQRLAGLVAAQVAAPDDAELFHDTDVLFHKAIVDAAGNAVLSAVGRVLQARADAGRGALLARPERRRQSIEDHRLILAALLARDAGAAGAAMGAHMAHVEEALGGAGLS